MRDVKKWSHDLRTSLLVTPSREHSAVVKATRWAKSWARSMCRSRNQDFSRRSLLQAQGRALMLSDLAKRRRRNVKAIQGKLGIRHHATPVQKCCFAYVTNDGPTAFGVVQTAQGLSLDRSVLIGTERCGRAHGRTALWSAWRYAQHGAGRASISSQQWRKSLRL